MQSWTKYYFFQRVSRVLKPREFFRSSSVKGHPLLGYPAPVLGDMHGTLHGLIMGLSEFDATQLVFTD